MHVLSRTSPRYVLADISVVYLSLQCSFCVSGAHRCYTCYTLQWSLSLHLESLSVPPSVSVSLSLSFNVLVASPEVVQGTWSAGLCSTSTPHNHTIRTHRSSCCLWPTTFAFTDCVTVLETTTIALRCILLFSDPAHLDNIWIISVRTYLAEVLDRMYVVPCSSRLFCSQTTGVVRSTFFPQFFFLRNTRHGRQWHQGQKTSVFNSTSE